MYIEKATDENGQEGYLIYGYWNEHRFIPDSQVPFIPKIDARILEEIEKDRELFSMCNWDFGVGWDDAKANWCKTGHCRGGWAITLAGKAGEGLKGNFSPALAGSLIYFKSRPGERIPDFYCSDEEALEDIKACAARQIQEAEVSLQDVTPKEERKTNFREFLG